MSFADELNSKVNDYKSKTVDKPDVSSFLNRKINQYIKDIEGICRREASKGKREIKGFFVPTYYSYYDEVTSSHGQDVLRFPMGVINKKPYYNERFTSMNGGAADVEDAIITLLDGIDVPQGFAIDTNMIESVRIGLIKGLSGHGFRKLEITLLSGPKYEMGKKVFSTGVIKNGTAHYYYVDIEW